MSFDVIREGVLRFRNVVFPRYREMYQALADRQRPFALFLTCGDSRIDPSLLTGTEPGQIFVERTPGNIVPIYDDTVSVGVSASIEYAIATLGVADVIVCGHSTCGAMMAVLEPGHLDHTPATARWLKYAAPAGGTLEELAKRNVVEQLAHLETHPSVRERRGQLRIHGWYYEIHTGAVQAYDPATGKFALWP